MKEDIETFELKSSGAVELLNLLINSDKSMSRRTLRRELKIYTKGGLTKRLKPLKYLKLIEKTEDGWKAKDFVKEQVNLEKKRDTILVPQHLVEIRW